MKTPEKIYLATTKEVQNLDHSFVGIAHSDPQDIVEPIEYIRTDAFIEKATEWLNNFYNENTHSFLIDEDIEKFINYMKGE